MKLYGRNFIIFLSVHSMRGLLQFCYKTVKFYKAFKFKKENSHKNLSFDADGDFWTLCKLSVPLSREKTYPKKHSRLTFVDLHMFLHSSELPLTQKEARSRRQNV